MKTLLKLWVTFGGKVAKGYAKFVNKVRPLSTRTRPFMIVGFAIPWFVGFAIPWFAVLMVLLGLDILYGKIVYGLGIREQWGWFKEGITEGLHKIS